jgi:hypothetical protein
MFYFFTGIAGAAGSCFAASGLAAGGTAFCTGAAGTVCWVTGIFDLSISDELLRVAVYVSAKEVSIKIIATAAVIFPKKVPAPVEPKTVWLEPPNAAPILAPFPACNSTTKISTRQTKTCKITNKVCIFILFFNLLRLSMKLIFIQTSRLSNIVLSLLF